MTLTQYIEKERTAAAVRSFPAGRRAKDFIVDELFPHVPGLYESFVNGANFLLTDCGGGKALHRMALRFPQSRFVGIDELSWNVLSAADHARTSRIANLWFHLDAPGEVELPPVYNVVVQLDPDGRRTHHPSHLVRIASAVRPGGAIFIENDNGLACATLVAMGFRSIRSFRPTHSPSRRIIVAQK